MPNLNKDLINDTLSVDLDSTQTLSNKTLTTPIINGPTITATGQTPVIHGIYLPEPHVIYFEGSTADGFETILTVVDPTADRTVSLPDASGTLTLANSDVTFANLTVSGDLIVSGNTTTINTANLNVEDSFILLNSGETGSPTLNSGLEVERGTSTNVFIRWDETTDKWQFTNDGSTYNDLGSGGGATNSLTAPAAPTAGALWFKTDTAQTFVYYDSYWVEVGASGMAAMVSDTAPSSPIAGQIWFNSLNGGTYVYYSSAWAEIGAVPINALLNTIDAKGDLIAGTADNTVGRLGVGTNGFSLKANSSTATGLEWASVPTISILDDVGDVTITSATNGDLLKWNGTAWVNAAGYALLASPALTGTPTAPTAAAATNTTQVATTAFVTDAVSGVAIDALNDITDVTITSAANGDLLEWNGTAWVNAAPAGGGTPGLVPIIPTSVSVGSGSATTSANGMVTFTGANSVSLDGIFSAAYRNYRVVWNCDANADNGNLLWKVRVGGATQSTDINGTGIYSFAAWRTTSASAYQPDQCGRNISYTLLGDMNSNSQGTATMDIFMPFLTKRTSVTSLYVSSRSDNHMYIVMAGGQVNTVASYDGMFMQPSGASNGTVSVYGYTI
jgi:hypothetical protein